MIQFSLPLFFLMLLGGAILFLSFLLLRYYSCLYRNGTWNLYTNGQLAQPARMLPMIGSAMDFKAEHMHIWTHEWSRQVMFDNWIHYLPGMPIVVINRGEDIEFIFGKGNSRFVKGIASEKTMGWWAKGSMLLEHGHEWRRQRKMIAPAFHFEAVKKMQTIIELKLEELIKNMTYASEQKCLHELENSAKLDIAEQMSQFTLDVLGLIGFKYDFASLSGDRRFIDAAQAIVRESWARTTRIFPFQQLKMQRDGRTGVATLDHAIQKMLNSRREKGIHEYDTDFLSHMLRQQDHLDSSWMTEDVIVRNLRLFIIAGSDTTSSWLASTIYLVSITPNVDSKLFSELRTALPDGVSYPLPAEKLNNLPYLQAVLKEVQRFRPSTPAVARSLDHGILTLPSGTVVTSDVVLAITTYSIHRNDLVWGPDADSFRPERWLEKDGLSLRNKPYDINIPLQQAYIPFIAGQRGCLGQHLAHLEATLVVASLFRNFKFSMPADFRGEPRLENAITLLYPDGLPMIISKRA